MSDKCPPISSQNYNTYSLLSVSLTLTGTLLITISILILQSTPFTALGISTIILGTVTYAIYRGQTKIPLQASAILLQSGNENTSALIEEIGLKTKAIYLPSSITGDKPKALIPLDSQIKLGKKILPKRLIVKYGPRPQDVGLLIITPGSLAAEVVEAKPEASAGDLETAVANVLAGTVALADGARVVVDAENVFVEIQNPHLEQPDMWIHTCTGTPVASIVASVIAQIIDRPIRIQTERATKNKLQIDLQVLERAV